MKNSKQTLLATLVATIGVALCCFTPILVIALTSVGLAMWIGYLDYILLPLLGALIGLTIWRYRQYQKKCHCQNK